MFVPNVESASPPFALVFLDPPFDMFDSPESTKRVFARVSEILAGQALEEGGTVVLRHPSEFRGDPPLPVTDRRRHGQSVVLMFTKGAKASP